MVRKLFLFAALVMGVATLASAKNSIRPARASQAAYRIELHGNSTVLSKDQPVRRGSVVLFHRYPDGLLTGIPVEEIAAVSEDRRFPARGAASLAGFGAVPLQPGDAVLLGPTGEGNAAAPAVVAPGPPSPSSEIPARLAVESQVFPGDLPAQTGQRGAGGTTGAMVNGTPIYSGSPATTVINPTLANGGGAANTANVPTSVGPNGFPTMSAAPQSGVQPINPNGFPATTTTGPQSGVQPINPNGFPATTTTGPQSGAQPIDPNGFPALNAPPTSPSTAPAGTRGSTAANAAATSASTASAVGGPPAGGTTAKGAATQAPPTSTSKTSPQSASSSTPH